MYEIEQIDVFTVRCSHHYKIGGHEEAPGALPGTDYYIEPQWTQAYSRATESCLVKITTSNGLTGWGEAQAPLTPQTPCTLITTLLGPFLISRDFRATAVLYDRMYNLMLARGHFGSFLFDALAGLDVALWDLKGRSHGVPVFELLGGPFRLQHTAYISGLRKKTLAEKVEAASGFQQHGFAGIKIFTGPKAADTENQARTIRAVLAAESFFAVDALWAHNLTDAIRVGHCLDELHASWIESPLNPEDIAGHQALAKSISTPLAIGETLRTPRQFEPWLRSRALAIAQPDIMRTGITGAMRIAALADAFHAPTTLHTGVCTGIGMAATWQAAAALPGDLPQEHQYDLFETANSILRTPLSERVGKLEVPQKPGIGVEVDEDAVARISTEHWIVDGTGRRMVGGAS